VLLGWELGGGSGHIRLLQQIARELQGIGFCPVFALKRPDLLQAEDGWTVLQAPQCPNQAPPGFLAATFADVLACRGYAKPQSLQPLVQGWQEILNRVQPAVVVAEFSPTLCLAARGRFPVLTIGTGFTLPPALNGVFPRISQRGRALVPQEQILDSIQEVQHRLGWEKLESLSHLLETDERIVACAPELDPYGPFRTEPLAGPVEPMLAPCAPRSKKFFAYLGMEMPDCQAVLTALAQSGFPGQAFVRDADAALRMRISKLGLEMIGAPLPPEQIISEHAVIVHFGGAGMAHLALAAGRPQLLFPIHLEHLITGQKLHGLGVAHALSGTFLATHVTEALRQLMHDPQFARRAAFVAAQIHSRGPWDALQRIITGCQQLAESRQI
jgi:hypothetical protein